MRKQVPKAVDQAVAALVGLDILVNNAGISTSGVTESFPLHDFDRMLAVNVRDVFVAVQRAIPNLGCRWSYRHHRAASSLAAFRVRTARFMP